MNTDHSIKTHTHLEATRWFESGWERAIDVRASQWETLHENKREKITNRWSLSAAREIIASGENVPVFN
jgi:hypothetical protein